jgi:hypothetical protein
LAAAAQASASLHYDYHVEPNRLDPLFLPIWFLVPNLAVAAALFALVFGTEAALSGCSR